MRASKFLTHICKTLGRALRPKRDVASKFDVVSEPSTRRCAFSESEADARAAEAGFGFESDPEEIVLLRGSCFSDFERDRDDASDCATVVADSIYELGGTSGADAIPRCYKRSDLVPSHSRRAFVASGINPIVKLQHESQPHVISEGEKELFEGISPAFLTIMHCGGTASRRRRVRTAPAMTMNIDHPRA